MTSIPNLLKERLGIGETFCLAVEETDGRLVAAHPNPNSRYDVAVVEGLERLESAERPPDEPLEVEILGRFADGDLAGRVVGRGCTEVDNVDR